jgi:hypothetical protein
MTVKATACTAEGTRTGSVYLRTHKRACALRRFVTSVVYGRPSMNGASRTVFFYMATGTAHGGPLDMGATVIELDPNYPGKKQKKYSVYSTDVVDMQPVDRGQKAFDIEHSTTRGRKTKEARNDVARSSCPIGVNCWQLRWPIKRG